MLPEATIYLQGDLKEADMERRDLNPLPSRLDIDIPGEYGKFCDMEVLDEYPDKLPWEKLALC